MRTGGGSQLPSLWRSLLYRKSKVIFCAANRISRSRFTLEGIHHEKVFLNPSRMVVGRMPWAVQEPFYSHHTPSIMKFQTSSHHDLFPKSFATMSLGEIHARRLLSIRLTSRHFEPVACRTKRRRPRASRTCPARASRGAEAFVALRSAGMLRRSLRGGCRAAELRGARGGGDESGRGREIFMYGKQPFDPVCI